MVRHLVAAVVAAVVLGGCADDPTPQFEADPTPSPSASPTPDEPEPWEEKSDDGAIAFVEHWVDVFDAAKDNGDTAELAAISSANCETCQNFIMRIEEIYSTGGYIESDGWQITSISEPIAIEGGFRVATNVLQSPQEINRGPKSKIERYDGGMIDFSFSIEWRRDGWTLLRLDGIQ